MASNYKIHMLPGDLKYAHSLLEEWALWAQIDSVVSSYSSIFKKKAGRSPLYPPYLMERVDACVSRTPFPWKKEIKDFYLKHQDTHGPVQIKKALQQFFDIWESSSERHLEA